MLHRKIELFYSGRIQNNYKEYELFKVNKGQPATQEPGALNHSALRANSKLNPPSPSPRKGPCNKST